MAGRAIAGLRWVATYRVATQLVTWAITIFVVRLLTPEDYGLMAIAGIALNLASVFDDFGLGTALVQQRRIRSGLCQGVFGIVAAIATVIVAGLWLVGPSLAEFMGEPRVTAVVQAASLAVAFNMVGSPVRSLLARHSRFARLGAIDLGAAVAASVTSLMMALAGFGVWALVAANLVNSGIRMALVLGFSPCRFRFRVGNFSEVLPLARFGVEILGSRVFAYGAFNMDKAVIARLLGSGPVGFFSVGQQFAWIPIDKGLSMLTQVAYPAFARLARTPEQGRAEFVKLITLNTAVFLPVMWVAAASAIPVVPAVLGDHWKGAAPAFAGFAFVVPLEMIRSLTQLAVTARGRSDVVLRNSATNMVFTLAGVSAGVSLGLVGAITGWVAGYAVGWVWAMLRSAKCLGIPWLKLPIVLVMPGLATAAWVSAALLGLRMLGVDGDLLWTILAAVAAVVGAYGTLALLDRALVRQALAMLRRLFSRDQP